MKKQILLLSTLGAASGLLYALESNRRKQNRNGKAAGAQVEESEHLGKLHAQPNSRSMAGKSNGTTGQAASMARIGDGKADLPDHEVQPVIDDKGTDQFEASQILKHIRDNGFDGSDEKLALALGRPTEEIEECTSGDGLIDGDVIMKARTLALQRGLDT